MTCERDTRTMLSGKTILLLSNGEDSTSELGLKLSLHGGTVLVIGKNRPLLARLQHEVRDTGGTLEYCVADYDDLATAQSVSMHIQATGGAVYALVDNTGHCDQRYARAVLESLEHPPTLMITLNHANGDHAHTQAALPGIKTVVVHTDVSGSALPHAINDLPSTIEIYSALVAREVVYALGENTYQAVKRITLVDNGDMMLARLSDDESKLVRTVRRGRTLEVYITHTPDMGRAVFAGRDFKRGDLIFEMHGTQLDHQTEHTIQIDWQCHLEPDSPIRLINHSCEPNVGIKTNADGLPDFYAFRDIQQGEELNFDYAMTEYTHYPRADETLEFSLECRCGTPSCRGKLGYYSELPDATKQQYDGFVSAYFATLHPKS